MGTWGFPGTKLRALLLKKASVAVCTAILLMFGLLEVLALSPDEYLQKVAQVEAILPKLFKPGQDAVLAIIPNPSAYEITLPAQEKVLESKDKLNFKNYAGLSEAYLYSGNIARAEQLYDWTMLNYKTILGEEDSFVPGLVGGDFAIYYYYQKDYKRAEAVFRQSVDALERHGSAAATNNLIAAYAVLSCICKETNRKEEAIEWAKKLVALCNK